MIEGSIASLFLLILPYSTYSAIVSHLCLRALQLLYLHHKSKGRIHVPNGEVLLFALSCAQIMFAFIRRPDSIPKSYNNLMMRLAGKTPALMTLNRRFLESNGALDTDLDSVIQTVKDHGGKDAATTTCRNLMETMFFQGQNMTVPCEGIHGRTPSCFAYSLKLAMHVFRVIGPVYLGLNIVPMMVLKRKAFLAR